MLTCDSLRGVWSGLPTPFDSRGSVDTECLEENIHRACQFDIGGVYSTGGTGEFYAVELDEFRRLADTFVAAGHAAGKPVQLGCTWCNTRGVIRRMEIAQRSGADGVQVALPFWFVLSDAEILPFFKDISSACPGLPIIHYNSVNARRSLTGPDYRRISGEVPELIGSKYPCNDAFVWQTLMAESPNLAHFTAPEVTMPTAMMYGARGCYSIYIVVVPELMLHYYHLCVEKRWDEASVISRRITAFFNEAIMPLVRKGYADCALDKAAAEIAGLLRPSGSPAPPYRALSADDMQFLRSKMEKHDFAYRK